MMDLLLRIGGALAGLAMVFAFLRSVLQVAVVNRRKVDWLARRVGCFVYTILARQALNRRSYDQIQDVLAWSLPLYILLLIMVWFILVQAGFSLLIWSSQAEHSLLQAVIASGSALSTLGFLTPPETAGRLLAIPEGAIGLGVVVFFFTFIPSYQTAIQAREVRVAWLYARACIGIANFGLIEWIQRSGSVVDMSGLWEDWEGWFRNLVETHTLAPVLAFVPSVHRGQTWLVAAAAVLDAASFCLSTLDTKGLPSATVCHTTGVNALRLLAAELADHRAVDSPISESARFGRVGFDAACERLATLGAQVKGDRDTCWGRFTELRSEYESFLSRLAVSLLVPFDNPLLLPLAGSRVASCSPVGPCV
jgi:hypothetical protein